MGLIIDFIIKRFDYLQGTCSKDSFYGCIGSQLKDIKDCQENGLPCSLYSLPTKKPLTPHLICQKWQTLSKCERQIEALRRQCRTKTRPCSIKEYGIHERATYAGKGDFTNQKLRDTFLNSEIMADELTMDDLKHMIVFTLALRRPPSTRGIYNVIPQKEIHTEHLSVTGLSLFGNIGGYMGLFVGFSFTGFVAWILKIIRKALRSLAYDESTV